MQAAARELGEPAPEVAHAADGLAQLFFPEAAQVMRWMRLWIT